MKIDWNTHNNIFAINIIKINDINETFFHIFSSILWAYKENTQTNIYAIQNITQNIANGKFTNSKYGWNSQLETAIDAHIKLV